jgi:hypothetical protein
MAEDPGKASIGELVKAIHNGEYVIPYFQRGYEWEPSYNVSESSTMKKWSHLGGKLRELGAEALSDTELLAIPSIT